MKATQKTQQHVEATNEIPVEPSAVDEEPAEDLLPLDVVFEILKNRRRRLVLQYLDENDSQTTLSDLAEHIAAIENDKTTAELGSQERKRVYVGLYQCHLPRMHDSGAIEFDDDRGTVSLGSNADQLYEYLDENDAKELREWSSYYLAHAGISTTLLVAAAVFFGSFVGALLVVAFVGFSTIAAVHWLVESR